MSNTREIVTDLPTELRHMLGEGEEVYYKGKTKKYAPGGLSILLKYLFYNHKFFGKGTIEDLHYGDILNTKMKKGILSCKYKRLTELLGRPAV